MQAMVLPLFQHAHRGNRKFHRKRGGDSRQDIRCAGPRMQHMLARDRWAPACRIAKFKPPEQATAMLVSQRHLVPYHSIRLSACKAEMTPASDLWFIYLVGT